MAAGDNRARQSASAAASDAELAALTVKANPTAKVRLPEDTARVGTYAAATQKDVLPEHTARRTTYSFITAVT